MYWLLRGLRLTPEAAFFGALVFALSTFWRCKITNLGLLEGISWIPGLLFYLLLSLETGSWVARLTAGLLFSLVVLAGVPHTVIYTFILLLLVTLGYSFAPDATALPSSRLGVSPRHLAHPGDGFGVFYLSKPPAPPTRLTGSQQRSIDGYLKVFWVVYPSRKYHVTTGKDLLLRPPRCFSPADGWPCPRACRSCWR